MLHKGRLLEALNRLIWASFDRFPPKNVRYLPKIEHSRDIPLNAPIPVHKPIPGRLIRYPGDHT